MARKTAQQAGAALGEQFARLGADQGSADPGPMPTERRPQRWDARISLTATTGMKRALDMARAMDGIPDTARIRAMITLWQEDERIRARVDKLARMGGLAFPAPVKPRAHGLSSHLLYGTWRTMIRRCENPKVDEYLFYGGRGITVCPEWHDVAEFITWIEANLGPRPVGMTLDRIDNDGNYEPGNVKWSTTAEQAANRRPAWPAR